MVGGNHDVRCKQWKFVIDFRSSQSSSGAFMHSLNGRSEKGRLFSQASYQYVIVTVKLSEVYPSRLH